MQNEEVTKKGAESTGSEHHLKDKVVTQFVDLYGTQPNVIVRAPGRINLIGEHTDYNHGLVLPASIDKSIVFAFKANDTQVCHISALDIDDEATIRLDNLERTDRLWINYLIGILIEFEKRGTELANTDKHLNDDQKKRGFDCVFSGDIPIGAGLSSSAALDCGFIKGVAEVYREDLSLWDIVNISNTSNNDFLKINSGILDQFASVFGRENKCIFMDCESREYAYYDFDLGAYSLVLINTKVTHVNSDSGYNDRPAECQELLKVLRTVYPDLKSMRQVNNGMLLAGKCLIERNLYNRAKFILEENERVVQSVAALQNHDFESFGGLLYASHHGLQYKYEVSCEELDLLVDLAREEGVLGSRMMGGGFGGCTLNLIKTDQKQETLKKITSAYYQKTNIEPEVYEVKIGDGVSLLS